ncbi:MAG TPA: hypothetical protein VJA47_00595 [archaeon]|nr:hypothetical protein [archaeon]
MPKKYKANFCNIDFKERINRALYSLILFLITAYLWYTLLVNKLGGWNKFIIVVPLYLAFLTVFEAGIGWCVLKSKASRKSGLIHLLSVASAVIVSVVLMFI